MPKYLDLTGLTTLKSKLDTTYAKKNDVYTKAQVDSAIAGAGLPTITIAQSQVVSQDPIQIQATDEQFAAMNGRSVILDVSALGMSVIVLNYAGTFTDDDNNEYLSFVYVSSLQGWGEMIRFDRIIVYTSTKIAEIDIAYPQYADQAGEASLAGSVNYLTTAPSSANTGSLKIVVLDSEPATRYAGYLYIITESN